MSSYFVDQVALNGNHSHQVPLIHLPHANNPPSLHRSLAPLLNNTNINTNDFPQFYHPNQPIDEEDDEDEEEDEDDVEDEDAEEEPTISTAINEALEKERKPLPPHPVTTLNVIPKTIVEPVNISNPITNPSSSSSSSSSKKELVESDQPNKKSPIHEVKTNEHASVLDGTDSMELLRENRALRKKVELLMKHNMQLMVGIKDRDHKIYKQKQLLAKYRKALLRFFEENGHEQSSSSEDEELSNLSNEERKVVPVPKERKETHAHVQPTLPPPATANNNSSNNNNNLPAPLSPVASPIADDSHVLDSPGASEDMTADKHDFDDISSNNGEGMFSEFYAGTGSSKKRKLHDRGDDDKPDKKRKGTRRNALWSTEDDELFAKVYNVYGKSWKTIHNFLPNKTREQVQSHGQYLIRIGKLEDIKGGTKRGRKAGKKSQPTTPPPQSNTSSTNPTSSNSNQSSYSQSPAPTIYQYHYQSPDPQMMPQ